MKNGLKGELDKEISKIVSSEKERLQRLSWIIQIIKKKIACLTVSILKMVYLCDLSSISLWALCTHNS
jgi:hypothetical protein